MSTDDDHGPGPDEAYCSSCGAIVKREAEICPDCGVRRRDPPRSSLEKSPAIAALLSFIIVGAGQVYNGQIAKGIVFFVGMWFVAIFAVFFFWLLIPLFAPLALWLYNIYDAYDQAQKLNLKHSGG